MKKLILILLMMPVLFFNCEKTDTDTPTPPETETTSPPEEETDPEDEAVTPPPNNALSQDIFNPTEEGYELFWEDNFEGTKLDTKKWKPRNLGPSRIGYTDASMIEVKNGYLYLSFDIKKGVTEDRIMRGAVGTQETFMTTYGYFECRAKMPQSIGPWAAFWLQSTLITKGEDPAIYGAEVDIFEYMKKLGNDHMTHCVHWAYGPNIQSVGRLNSKLQGLSDGFHTFALEWTPEKYAFFIDGLKFHEIREGLSHIDQYIILSFELPRELKDIKDAIAPDRFIIDYVRVYKK